MEELKSEKRLKVREREREAYTERGREGESEAALPAPVLSGLQAAEQWQETGPWNFPPASGHALPLSRVLWPPRRPALHRYVTVLQGRRGRGRLQTAGPKREAGKRGGRGRLLCEGRGIDVDQEI